MRLGTFKRDFSRFVAKFPYEVQEIIKKKAYLAGGALRSLTLCEKPNDYDIYFLDQESLNSIITASHEIKEVLFTTNAITFLEIEKERIIFQIIRNYVGNPNEVISKFDFTVNMNFYVPAMEWGEVKYQFNINNKELVFNPKATTPFGALLRVQRFLREGWTIKPEQLARIGVAISRQGSIEDRTASEIGLSDSSSGTTEKLYLEEIMSQDINYIRGQSPLFNPNNTSYDLWRNNQGVGYVQFEASHTLAPRPVDPMPVPEVSRPSLEQAVNRVATGRTRRRRGSSELQGRSFGQIPFDEAMTNTTEEHRTPVQETRPSLTLTDIQETARLLSSEIEAGLGMEGSLPSEPPF